MNYKYCIKEKLEKLPVAKYKVTKLEIIKALQKTGRTFNRYCNLMVQDHSDIPTQDLDIIASYLECSADELKNYKVQRSTILHKIVRKSSKKSFLED